MTELKHWMPFSPRRAMATVIGLKNAFLNQPVEVTSLRSDLATVIGIPGRRLDLVMRLGHDAAMPFSTRRPINGVMI